MGDTNPLENPKEEESPILTCEICIEPMTEEKKFKNKEGCSHPFCLDCIVKYIEVRVVNHTAAEVPCPSINCDQLLDPLSCRLVLPAGLFEKWCDVLCKSTVRSTESAYCPLAECSELVLNECGDQKITRSKCPNCKKLFCFQCQVPWHAFFGCRIAKQMREKNNENLFSKLVKRNKWRRCPGCKYHVELSEGCQNILCRCGVLFCYDCGKIRDVCDCRRVHDGPDLDTRRGCWATVPGWAKKMMVWFVVNAFFIGLIIALFKIKSQTATGFGIFFVVSYCSSVIICLIWCLNVYIEEGIH